MHVNWALLRGWCALPCSLAVKPLGNSHCLPYHKVCCVMPFKGPLSVPSCLQSRVFTILPRGNWTLMDMFPALLDLRFMRFTAGYEKVSIDRSIDRLDDHVWCLPCITSACVWIRPVLLISSAPLSSRVWLPLWPLTSCSNWIANCLTDENWIWRCRSLAYAPSLCTRCSLWWQISWNTTPLFISHLPHQAVRSLSLWLGTRLIEGEPDEAWGPFPFSCISSNFSTER